MGKTIRRLVLAVNGERYELSEIDPSTTLLEFLRTQTPYKGAKLGCGEGEAVYVDDIPSPKNCLYGAFIYSTRPLAHVRGIKFSSSLASQKIVTVVSVNDIPKGGENVGSNFVFGSESLFAGSLTEYAGQPLGVVIAETQKHANMAAKLAIVEYDTGNLGRQSFLWKMLSEDPVILMFLLIFLLNK